MRTKKFLKVVTILALLGSGFTSCSDEFAEDRLNDKNESSINSTKAETVTITYDIHSFVTDVNGVKHRFDGKITITYLDGRPITGVFTGFYDGEYYEDVVIVLLAPEEGGYSYFENDPETLFVDLLDHIEII